MKLAGPAALRYLSRPEPDRSGVLIFGADPMRVALRRQELITALISPSGEHEMRLFRISGAELRKDPAALIDAIKAQGFFPGPRVAFVEDASDAATALIQPALEAWRKGDATLVVTSGSLTAKSSLRKLFEAHANSVAIGIYDDPPSREEIEAVLRKAGLGAISPEAMTDLFSLARELDPGDFRQTVEKIALYKLNDQTPLSSLEVSACAPATVEADVDDLLSIVAEGRTGDLGPMLQRLSGQGVLPVTLAIFAQRHFRALHAASAHPGGVAAGLASARPPIFGPRRDRMLKQAQGWGLIRLEEAIQLLVETDLSLRSSSQAPAMAVMERALIRLAMMRRA
jgi:DNA polymerase-3 subunit delta